MCNVPVDSAKATVILLDSLSHRNIYVYISGCRVVADYHWVADWSSDQLYCNYEGRRLEKIQMGIFPEVSDQL